MIRSIGISNPWWRDGTVSNELALPFKRKAFEDLIRLAKLRPITMVSGLRRVGKSTLLYQLIQHLLEEGVEAKKILYFSFDERVDEITDILSVYKDNTGVEWERDRCFVFLDEIQKLKGWSNKLKIIYDSKPNVKFIVTGSSSFKLESEAMKNLAGRYFDLFIDPLSFNEYLELKGSKIDLRHPKLWEGEIKNEFRNYLPRAYPEIIGYKDISLVKRYIKETVIDRILRDDIERFKGVSRELLETLVEIFYGSPGVYINYDSMSNDLKVSKKTLIKHVMYLESSYIIRIVKNFRPGMMNVSKKLQRAYPYHFSLAFGWTGNIDLETEVTSFLDAKYYWRHLDKEIDVLVIDEKKRMTPVEIKEGQRVNREDMRHLVYFANRFKTNVPIIVYRGDSAEYKIGDVTIDAIPEWKLLTGISEKLRELKQNNRVI